MGILARVIFLAALGTLLNFAHCDSNEEDSDDEESLREALTLIKLIRRAAGPDVSRERNELSKHAPAPVPAPLSPDAPQQLHNVSSYNNTSTFRQYQSIYRRSMPEESNYRRSMADGEESNTTDGNTITLSTESAITRSTNSNLSEASSPVVSEAILSTAPPTKAIPPEVKPSEIPTKVAAVRSNKAQFNNDKLAQKTSRPIKIQNLKNKQQQKKNVNSRINEQQNPSKLPAIVNVEIPKDLIINQVASELEAEMKTIVNRKEAARSRQKFLKGKLSNRHSSQTKQPTTLRIHLQGSSRYPIPFPENHALCYTDPKNGLCSVPI